MRILLSCQAPHTGIFTGNCQTQRLIEMNKKKKIENLKAHKLQLAEKYDRMAKVANSEPKRISFRRRAARFRYQLKMLEVSPS